MAKKRNHSIVKNDLSLLDRIAVYIIAFAVSIVPLYLRLNKVELTENMKKYWTGEDSVYDVFSFVKARLLIFVLAALALYWLIRIAQRRGLPSQSIYIPMAVYVLLLILSTVLSKQMDVSLMGFVDRYEGLFVILAYLLIMITAFTVVRNENSAMVIVMALLISANLISLIGISQFFDFDILQTNFGRSLMVPDAYRALRDTLKFNFAGTSMMYTTLYNPNYTGSYTVLILPLSIAFFYHYLGKSKGKAIFMFISALLAFVLWLGGMSRAGLVGGIILFAFLVFFLRKSILANWKQSLALLLSFVIIYAGMDVYSGGLVTREFRDTVPMTLGQDNAAQNHVKSAVLKDNTFTFETKTETFVMKLEGEELSFYDGEGKALVPYQDKEVIKFEDARYEPYAVEIDKSVAYVSYGQAVMPFIFAEGKMFYAPTKYMLYEEVSPAESLGFENHQGYGSGRGYLWSRSLPLLKDTVLIGHGPDTYAIYYPQSDIAGKINGLGYATLIVDKPHNWYLHIAISTGILSLVAMLTFLAWYVVKAFIKWLRIENSFDYTMGIASLCAVIGYCVVALANDSNVAVAPVFWAVLGVGLAFLFKGSTARVATSKGR